jgi:hypothetical protein
MGEDIVEVFVFGVPREKFRLHRGVGVRYNIGSGFRRSQHMVEIFSEKLGVWLPHPCNVAFLDCPVCGKLMKCYYIPGTTWMALCGEECRRELDEKVRELGDLWKALHYLRSERCRRGR